MLRKAAKQIIEDERSGCEMLLQVQCQVHDTDPSLVPRIFGSGLFFFLMCVLLSLEGFAYFKL